MKKTQKSGVYHLISTLLIIGAFSLGYILAGNNKEITSSDTGLIGDDGSSQERDKGTYSFISPLLECDIRNGNAQQKYIPFEKELKETIDTAIIQKHPDVHVSFYFRNLNNGPWFGINEEEAFAPASLMKLPIAMSYMKWSETDSSILTRQYNIDRETGSTQNFIPEEQLSTGSTYSVIDLISRALIYSDNDANRTLVDNIPNDTLMSIFKDLSIPIIDDLERGSDNYISVKEYASFFRILYNASYLERSSSEKLLSILSQSKFTEGIRKSIPSSIPVAHKFGERVFFSQELNSNIAQLHDCGIVYYDHYPYLLCVMTKGKVEFSVLEGIIQDISGIVFETIQKKYP